jgi:hypothetical protein
VGSTRGWPAAFTPYSSQKLVAALCAALNTAIQDMCIDRAKRDTPRERGGGKVTTSLALEQSKTGRGARRALAAFCF